MGVARKIKSGQRLLTPSRCTLWSILLNFGLSHIPFGNSLSRTPSGEKPKTQEGAITRHLTDVPFPRRSPVMALVPLPFGGFGAYASTFRHGRSFLNFHSKSFPLDTYLLMVLGILGLSAGPCENGPSIRKSVAGFFLQRS